MPIQWMQQASRPLYKYMYSKRNTQITSTISIIFSLARMRKGDLNRDQNLIPAYPAVPS